MKYDGIFFIDRMQGDTLAPPVSQVVASTRSTRKRDCKSSKIYFLYRPNYFLIFHPILLNLVLLERYESHMSDKSGNPREKQTEIVCIRKIQKNRPKQSNFTFFLTKIALNIVICWDEISYFLIICQITHAGEQQKPSS